jgi:formyl-CoA transferase
MEEKEITNKKGGPLEGMKVLDLGLAGAGPIGPTLLAEWGAEVIKVEIPEQGNIMRRIPPFYKGVSFWKVIEGRNKKSLAIDLHTEKGQRLIKELVKEYDIVVENFRPGTLERWHLGYDELKRHNEKVILVRVSGFGQHGPYRDRTSYDTIGAAMGGIINLNGYSNGSPVPLGLIYCDYITAAFNALACLIAVYYRQRNGSGQWADIPQYEAIFRILEWTVAAYDKLGLVRTRTGNQHPSIAPGDLFKTKDDRWIIIVANNDETFAGLAQAIGKEELVQAPRFCSIAQRADHAEIINGLVQEWTAKHTLAELEGLLEEAVVPFSAVYTVKEIFDDPHIRHSKNIIELEDPVVGRVKVPNTVPRFSLTPGQVRDTGAELGQHTEEILSRLPKNLGEMAKPGVRKASIQAIRGGEDQALGGLRIIELGPGLSAGFGASLLADFGAECIKIEPPGIGDSLRKFPPFYQGASLWWAVEARNKKSITLDLNDRRGQDIFRQLVRISDVVIESYPPGTLEGWCLSYDQIRKINDKIIMARVSGFGQDGPYRSRSSCDAVAAAFAGFTYLTGFPDDSPLKPNISVAEYLAGVFVALSIMAVLYYRDKTGQGQVIDQALYEPLLRFYHDNIPAYDKMGLVRERMGNALSITGSQVCFETKDGKWIAMLGRTEERDFRRFVKAIGQEELAQDPRFDVLDKRVENNHILNRIVADWVRTKEVQELINIMVENQVPISLVYSIEDIFQDDHYRERNNIIQVADSGLGSVKMQGVVPRLSLTPGKVEWAGPSLGLHNDEIYQALLGYSPEDMAELGASGVI